MNQEVQDYIKKAREAGMSDEQIKQELLKVGWQQVDVDSEFNSNSVPASPIPEMKISENKSIFYYYLAVLKKYFTFSGRARRREYWSFFLVNFFIGILLAVIGLLIKDKGIMGSIYSLLVMIPGLAVLVRRLHDTNHSGWWWFIGLIPLVGAIILLVFIFKDSQSGANKYGLNPKTELTQNNSENTIVESGEKSKFAKIILPIIIVIVLIVLGVLGYIFLIKPTAPNGEQENKAVESNIKDCGNARIVEKTSVGADTSSGVSMNYSITMPAPETANDKDALKCFDDALFGCQNAKLRMLTEDDGEIWDAIYEIKGTESDKCVLSIEDQKNSADSETCKISKEYLLQSRAEFQEGVKSGAYQEGTYLMNLQMVLAFVETFKTFPGENQAQVEDNISKYIDCK